MVRALERGFSIQKSRSFHLRKMFESSPGKQAQSTVIENGQDEGTADDKAQSRSLPPKVTAERPETQTTACPLPRADGSGARPPSPHEKQVSDIEQMKERFAKLLLGEDMSGGGKGVSSALALSNAITNLAASVFGEQWKLEPMSLERKKRWRKEVDWLLSVTDHIVEFVPSQQNNMEIMVTKQRNDLLVNIPGLRKLDAMLIENLDQFGHQNEFWYVSRDADEAEKGRRMEEKWWLPTAKVPSNGLSDATRRWLQFQKDSVNQILKAAMAINAQVLSEMSIPEDYTDSLPKNGRSSLGDSIYKSITEDFFDPEQFLSTMDLSSEHKVLDLKNRIEASIVIWKRKMNLKDGKSSWGSGVSLEKRELFEDRAETILLLLKQRFPGLPQSALDISKIQYNRDVGQAILESYSRVIESLAFTVISRIEDVLYADSLTQSPKQSPSQSPTHNPLPESDEIPAVDSCPSTIKQPEAGEEVDKLNTAETPTTKTLLDFIGWSVDKEETNIKKSSSTNNLESYSNGEHDKKSGKLSTVMTAKKTYLEKLENLSGLRSPTARH